MSNDYFNVKMLSDGKTADIKIYGEIGGWFGNIAEDLEYQIGESVENINVKLKSPGGSAFEGFEIYSFLKSHTAKVHMDVVGTVASAGTIILMAKDTSTIDPMAMLMIHDPQGGAYGKESELRSRAEMLKKIKENAVELYSTSMNKTPEEIAELMANETWYKADEAVEAGLVDKVFDSSEEDDSASMSFDKYGYKNIPAMLNTSITGLTEAVKMAKPDTLVLPVVDKAYLQANCADILKEIEDASFALGCEKGKTEECARIVDIEAMHLDGFEDVIKAGKADTKLASADVAVMLIKAQQAKGVAHMSAVIADAAETVVVPDTPIAQLTVKDDWDNDAKLRADFGDNKETYEAYMKATKNGLVKLRGEK